MITIDRGLGIDLGTTNSEVAMVDPSERDLHLYADKFGRKTVPSAVAWDAKSASFVVGREARRRRGLGEGAPVESIKRSMGSTTTADLGGQALLPEEISAQILRHLRSCMNDQLQAAAPDGVSVRASRAVITVPAYFDAPQLEATRRAGELAGLEVLGLLQEPTAAAVYHTWKRKLKDGSYLVYDLGGGTFDVSVLRCIGGEYQVIAIEGDNYLGGDDFDRMFAEQLVERLSARGYALEDLDVRRPDDARRFLALRHAAQEVKESLSTTEVVHVSKQEFFRDKSGEPVSLDAEFGRADYEAVIRPLVDRSIALCHQALATSERDAGVGLGDIDHVVLVGGSTRVPLVVERVVAELCAKAKTAEPLQEEVDTCVALGAAVRAASLGGLTLERGSSALTILTPLVSDQDEHRVKVRVDRAPEETRELAIADEEGPLDTAEVEDGSATLTVPLEEQEETALSLQVLDGGGSTLEELPLTLYRGDVRPRASGLSKPSVLAKSVAIEVNRGGRRAQTELLKKGVGLPAEHTHAFFTADSSGVVVLRLLQDRLPIKTLALQVPAETPVGTEVTVHVRCDEVMRIEARANVLGSELWAQIEPAQLEITADAEALDALLQRAEATRRTLWGHDAAVFRRFGEPMLASIRETVRTDPARAYAVGQRLAHLLMEFDGGQKLSPPIGRFEAVLNALRRTVFASPDALLGLSSEEWETRIAEIEARGMAAWEAGDAAQWKRAYNEARALDETVDQEDFARRSGKESEEERATRRAAQLRAALRILAEEIQDLELSAEAAVRELQSTEQQRILGVIAAQLAALREDALPTPRAVRDAVDAASSALSAARTAFERLPQLGVVSERGD